MKISSFMQTGLTAVSLLAITASAFAGSYGSQRGDGSANTLVAVVRQSTAVFSDVEEATSAGYGQFHGCTSGPQGGAMGLHLVNGDLVGDGQLDPQHPEALLYETRNGQMRLVGVEFVVIAEAWHASHEAPPVLMGQLFNYVSSPNRYGIPTFYELHVWAWKQNPTGVFADWNPSVSCEQFTADSGTHSAAH